MEGDWKTVGFLLFPGFEVLDLYGGFAFIELIGPKSVDTNPNRARCKTFKQDLWKFLDCY